MSYSACLSVSLRLRRDVLQQLCPGQLERAFTQLDEAGPIRLDGARPFELGFRRLLFQALARAPGRLDDDRPLDDGGRRHDGQGGALFGFRLAVDVGVADLHLGIGAGGDDGPFRGLGWPRHLLDRRDLGDDGGHGRALVGDLL